MYIDDVFEEKIPPISKLVEDPIDYDSDFSDEEVDAYASEVSELVSQVEEISHRTHTSETGRGAVVRKLTHRRVNGALCPVDDRH